eukprot:m.110711 g.110711  ORF g.110711 m.110711 type:complete len:1270 (+) comp9345_c0_seq1:206-4015(+)
MAAAKGPAAKEAIELTDVVTSAPTAPEPETDDDVMRFAPVGTLEMFKFTTTSERWLLVIAAFFGTMRGASWPVWALFFGKSISTFDPDEQDSLRSDINRLALLFIIAGCVSGTFAWISMHLLSLIGARISARIREHFLHSTLSQEMAWHDENSAAALEIRLSTNIPKIQKGISGSLAEMLNQAGQCLWGLGIALFFSWKLALVVIAASPIIVACFASFFTIAGTFATRQSAIYERAGIIAKETLHLLRVVMSFGTYDKEIARYHKQIERAHTDGVKSGSYLGLALGLPDFGVFLLFALCYWYGGSLVRDDGLDGGDILIVMFSALMGLIGAGQAASMYKTFDQAKLAARPIYAVINRKPVIDNLSEEGERPSELRGDITFDNVHFAYPSKPDQPVLRGLTFNIKSGQSMALVGPSGSGKSTVASLVERFYAPTSGRILIDGRPIQDYNIQWLHQQIGLVTQTPFLLPSTVFENIAIGKLGATMEEVQRAAMMANAHEFIMNFPNQYQTEVGELGGQLSGGQRQRIAIARVLIGNPKILLLDEATSALDNASERAVQAAIDSITGKGITSITIAHRLSTIRNSDKICVVDHGAIIESGSHEELVTKRGRYFSMLSADEAEAEASKNTAAPTQTFEVTGSTDELDKAGEDETEKINPADLKNAFWYAFRESRPDTFWLVLSVLGGIVAGLMWPANAIIMAEATNVVIADADSSEMAKWSLFFVGLAFVNLISHYLRSAFAFVAGERLTFRLRQQVFQRLVHQSPAFFDDPAHSHSEMLELLSKHTASMRLMIGDFFSLAIMIAAMIVGGLGVAFFYCWRIALVVLGALPVLIFNGLLMHKLALATEDESKKFRKATDVASLAISNVRLMSSLSRSKDLVERFSNELVAPTRDSEHAAMLQGIAIFFSMISQFGVFALAFWFGGLVVDKDWCSFDEMFSGLMGIVFPGMIAGFFAGQLPDFNEARRSSSRVIRFLRESQDPAAQSKGEEFKIPRGDIEFKNVTFAYPSRPNNHVLSNFSLKFPAGKKVALVGSSGSGKSTIVALLQKLYPLNEGEILVDGKSLAQMDDTAYRLQVVPVEQEPRLFNASIKENIAYGVGMGQEPTEAEVLAAAKQANVDVFVDEFDDGYNTIVGPLGGHLSGGQRQRVAIARALIRDDNVKIVLLDEATSALDVHTEKLVQAAMDKLSEHADRTTIIVAHRLSTIQNADIIAVLDHGKVIEMGSHDELLALRGTYFRLYNEGDSTPTGRGSPAVQVGTGAEPVVSPSRIVTAV